MDLRKLLEARSARALDVDDSGRVLVASDLTGTFQLYELDGELRQLTSFSEPVSGSYVPGSRRVVVAMDSGGNERHQLYLMDLEDPPLTDASKLEPLTSQAEYVHAIVALSRDGEELAYSSNRRNGIDFDLYVRQLSTGAEKRVYEDGGWVHSAGSWSPGGGRLPFVLPGPLPLDSELRIYDKESGTILSPFDHDGEAAQVGGPAWVTEDVFFTGSNVGREFTAIVRHDLSTGETTTVLEAEWDLECLASPDGNCLLVVANAGGASTAELYDVSAAGGLEGRGSLELPGRGVIAFSMLTPAPIVRGDGTVVYTYSSPVVPGDIWRAGTDRLERLTKSPGPEAESDDLVEPSTEEVRSFDGEVVPLFCYRPKSPLSDSAATPVVINVHGGPESQAVLTFNPVVQSLVAEGFAVLVPNVRGSTGYGKRYASLDDTTKRLDSVEDLRAIHGWLASAGLDPERAALYGGSYGGYMVLAGVAFQPELWAAGVDIVGISDLVTFLENTSSYRRAHREREYGSLQHDRSFLEKASPLSRADEIKAPLFVIHGANDPRVPVSEARQLVGSLAERGVPHELMIFEDEGHGLGKLASRLRAYPAAIQFLKEHMG